METQFIDIGGLDPTHKISGSFKLTFEDMFGETWVTQSIPVDGAVDNSAVIRSALRALPNDIINDVAVTSIGVNGKGIR